MVLTRNAGAKGVFRPGLPGLTLKQGVPPYTGIVATRGMAPVASIAAATATWTMSRSKHVARAAIVNPTIRFANFYVPSSNVETTLGAGTIKASIEYPVGTFTQCNEGEVSFPNGITSLTCNVSIPDGATFYVRTLQKNANGVVFSGVATNWFDTDEGFIYGTGAASDLTGGGAISQGFNRSQCYGPIAIVARTIKPSVLLMGDSRCLGTKDAVDTVGADTGELGRIIGPLFGYSKLASGGSTLSAYLSNRAYRDTLAADVSHIIDCYGINDLSATAATVAADRATFAALFPTKRVIGVTLAPTTSSTDSWATLANQTISNAKVATFNDLVRAGIAGERFYYDIADALDPGRTGKWPVTGAANYYTNDGVHETTAGNNLIASSGLIDGARIRR